MPLIRRETHRAGAFWVSFYEGQRGDFSVFHTDVFVPRAEAAHREICVSGRMRMVQKPDGVAAWPLIEEGAISDDRPDLLPGKYRYLIEEDGTRNIGVCSQRDSINRGAPLSHVWVNPLVAGKELVLLQGRIIAAYGDAVLDNGSNKSGCWSLHAATRGVTITARSNLRGIIVW
jgi:hypothetical protein